MLYFQLKVDREDHFYRSGFLHLIICALLRVHSLEFHLKKLDLTDAQKTCKFKGVGRKSRPGSFTQCSRVQIFFFFVERKSWDNSYMLWNKFQDYQVRFTLTYHCLVKRFDDLTRHL